jgi:cyclopropane fatty-acyl-phospholipid synthase-like methyltransferase
MVLVRPAVPDALRPTAAQALDAWARRVRADREQVDRLREVEDPADFYRPVAERFRLDPRRGDDDVVRQLSSLARPRDTWLDIGAGGGRYALPLAIVTTDVICVEPSTSMRAVLESLAGEHGIGNVQVIDAHWPLADGEGTGDAIVADVSLMAHIGYDIEAIGEFLDAMEAATRRLCVAVMGESAMTTVASLFWQPVHGEARVPLPALPELLTLLIARGRLPEVRHVDRVVATFDSFDDVLEMARRQLWVRPGSAKDVALQALVDEHATERDDRWALDWHPSRIGVVTWLPREDAGRSQR